MKLVKARARAPLIENGSFGTRAGFDSDAKQPTFGVTIYGPWVQGKGHTSEYTLHLTKIEMLHVVRTWLSELQESEVEAAKRAALPSGQ